MPLVFFFLTPKSRMFNERECDVPRLISKRVWCEVWGVPRLYSQGVCTYAETTLEARRSVDLLLRVLRVDFTTLFIEILNLLTVLPGPHRGHSGGCSTSDHCHTP